MPRTVGLLEIDQLKVVALREQVMRLGWLLVSLALGFVGRSVSAEVKLPAMFQDSMVLQRDQPIRVWGWAAPKAEVTIKLNSQAKTAISSPSGEWEVRLDAIAAGGPHEMVVETGPTEKSSQTIRDVMIGDVWLCSGQSNMGMTVSRSQDFESEKAAAEYPNIRMFRVASSHSVQPQEVCSGDWQVCNSETVGQFSATAYFFGRRLHRELNVPIGLINSSVGGTSIESWTSLSAQEAVAAIKPRLDAWDNEEQSYDAEEQRASFERRMSAWEEKLKAAQKAGKPVAGRKPIMAVHPSQNRNHPGLLFNGKISPLVGYTLRGAVWYQGENSSGRGFGHLYEYQLPTLILDWRKRWEQGDFPFAWAQLPNFGSQQQLSGDQSKVGQTGGWSLVQEGMLKTLSLPNTGMAVTIDVGDAKDIHPRNKQAVGHRLAQWALAEVYGKELIPMGPIYRSSKIDGARVLVEFDHAEGLKSLTDDVTGFAIAGTDKKFVWAEARIEGNRVIVSSPQVPVPVSVRYAWAANPVFSLVNSAGIPASPFRTDDWLETPTGR